MRCLPGAPLATLHGLGGTLHPGEGLRVALLKAGVLLGGALGLLAALLQHLQGALVPGAGGGGRLRQLHAVGAHALGGDGLHRAGARRRLAQGRHRGLGRRHLCGESKLPLAMCLGRLAGRPQLFAQALGAAGALRLGGGGLLLLGAQNAQLTGQKHRFQLADAPLQLPRGRGGLGLVAQRLKLRVQLARQVAQARQVRGHRLQFAAGLLLAAAVLHHSGRLLNHVAALLRGCVQDRIQLALAHEHVHVLTQAGLRQQVLDIAQARRGTVNLVLAAARTEHGARNLHPISGNTEGAVRIIEGQRHLGAAQGRALHAVARAGKDDVLHAAAAQALGALLAHDPGERIQHIGFAGAVRAHHGVNAGGELEGRGRGERLEPAQGQRHQVHKGPFCRRRCRIWNAAAAKPISSNLQVEPAGRAFRVCGRHPSSVRGAAGGRRERARGEKGSKFLIVHHLTRGVNGRVHIGSTDTGSPGRCGRLE